MKSHQLRSAGLTLLIHGVILALLMFLYISSPIPPWEEGLAGGGGGGSFVEFGTLDIEQGPITTAAVQPEQSAPEQQDDQLMTSDAEETVAIDQPEKKDNKRPEKKDIKKPDVKKTTSATVKTSPQLPKVEVPKVDPRSLYTGKKGTGGSPTGTQPGTGTGGSGNGNGGGDGDGTGPGTGTGTGGGNGGGKGQGDGIGFDLTGRNFRSLPKLEDRSQESGKIVIDIIVDKAGNVIRADGPARGSDITNGTLVRKCRDAAMKAKFSASPAGVEEQKGTITFNFILK